MNKFSFGITTLTLFATAALAQMRTQNTTSKYKFTIEMSESDWTKAAKTTTAYLTADKTIAMTSANPDQQHSSYKSIAYCPGDKSIIGPRENDFRIAAIQAANACGGRKSPTSLMVLNATTGFGFKIQCPKPHRNVISCNGPTQTRVFDAF